MTTTERYLVKHENWTRAWKNGDNPMVTVANPDKNQTNRLFIRVRANDYFGDPRAGYIIGGKLKEEA